MDSAARLGVMAAPVMVAPRPTRRQTRFLLVNKSLARVKFSLRFESGPREGYDCDRAINWQSHGGLGHGIRVISLARDQV